MKRAAALFLGLVFTAAEASPLSWEAWLRTLHQGAKVPARPDERPLGETLPLWVDCHLSWAFDHTSLQLEGIVLHSSPGLCKGQLEEWAPSVKTSKAP